MKMSSPFQFMSPLFEYLGFSGLGTAGYEGALTTTCSSDLDCIASEAN